MTATAEAPFLDFTDPTFATDSAQVRDARERSWYARTNYGLAILRYDEVSRLLKDPRLRQGSRNWPSLNGVTEGPFVDWWSNMILNFEGEDHARLRRIFNPVFSPRVIKALTPRFQALANELIDAFFDRGECEFMTEFAEPYAARVIAITTGLPESEWKNIIAWVSDMGLSLSVNIAEHQATIDAAVESLNAFADEAIAERRTHPQDDFISQLVRVRDEGDRLSDDELRAAVVTLVFGGTDTTANQLGLGMETFLEYPEQWQLLANHPEMGRAAVEEMMRVNPTVTWVTREAVEDFTFQNLDIEAGTTIHILSQSAGSDPRMFPDPTFDITAERAPHFGFGGGVHHCVGHFVARADMTEALPLLARRLRAPHVNGEVQDLPKSGNTGPIKLPIAFTPGDRS
jgi:cytochrome P450